MAGGESGGFFAKRWGNIDTCLAEGIELGENVGSRSKKEKNRGLTSVGSRKGGSSRQRGIETPISAFRTRRASSRTKGLRKKHEIF